MPTVNGDVDVSINVELEVEVYCSECGAGLCYGTGVKNGTDLHVDPCPTCKGHWQAD